MNNLKKLGLALLAITATFMLTGCGSSNVEGELTDLMTSVYEGVSEENLPGMLGNIEVTDEMMQYYIGTTELEVKEILASESGIGSVAHSIVLLRVEGDVEEAKTKIEENVDPRKWICVEAEEVIVDSKGDLIILIMTSADNAETIHNNFKNL